MIHTRFPDLDWLRTQTKNQFAARRDCMGNRLTNPGWPNVIMNVQTRFTYRDNIKGPLSLFTNIAGDSTVEAGAKRLIVRPGFFMLTNPEQHYTLDINTKTSAETFNIHFGDYFAEQVVQSLIKSPEAILDGADALPHERIYFYNRLHHKTEEIDQLIQFLHEERPSGMLLEEKLAALIGCIVRDERKLNASTQLIIAVKKSTRDEIVRRLLDSCDYIYSNYDRDISLDDLARVACLSRFHFLRLFRIAFQKTPHQFINDVRVQRSKELLTRTNFDVKTISSAVGFASSSSFSRMFFRQTGTYPTQYRTQ